MARGKDSISTRIFLENEGAELEVAKYIVGFVFTHGKPKPLTINGVDEIVPDMETNKMRILDPELQHVGQEINSRCDNYFSLCLWEAVVFELQN